MKRAKGTGTVFKLKGNRSKPYVAYVKTEKVYNEENQTSYQKRKAIGYFETQRQAQAALEKYLSNEYDLDESKKTFGAIWEQELSQMEISDKRRTTYKSTFKNYFDSIKDMPIREIKAEQLKKVMKACDKSSSTKANIKGIMRIVFSYATENDIVDRDYSQYVKYKKDDAKIKRQVFTKDEVDKLFENQGNYTYDFLLILLYTGMRPKELIDLTKDNIKDGCIYIVQSKTKAGIRTVPIHDKIKPIIDNRLSKQGKHLMTTTKTSKIDYDNFTSRELPKINELLGSTHTTYDCRHSFITNARTCRMDFLATQKIVGHKPTTITEDTYTHITLEELKSELAKFNY